MNAELARFIEHARDKGMDHATIRLMLLAAGWKEKEVVEALARTTLDVPVPAPPDRGGAREAFFHLLTFAAFYGTVISCVLLLFHYINRWFPDAAMQEHAPAPWELSAIRWQLAFVIVSFPIFLLLSRLLLREMRENPEKSWSGVRRWLTYLTLFLAALALGGDVITLVFRLLEGELTARFLLKVLVVLVVAGLSFAYYFISLKLPADRRESRRLHRGFAAIATALAVATVSWGFVEVGSPGIERVRKLDERRIDDLREIQGEIANISLGATRHEPVAERRLQRPLPATLEAVAREARDLRPRIVDPETGEPYGYEVLDENRFRLCATFRDARDEDRDPRWNHPAGQHCFDFDVLEGTFP
jgi:hypothetical protein